MVCPFEWWHIFGCHRYCIWKMKIIGIIRSRRRDTTADFDAVLQKFQYTASKKAGISKIIFSFPSSCLGTEFLAPALLGQRLIRR